MKGGQGKLIRIVKIKVELSGRPGHGLQIFYRDGQHGYSGAGDHILDEFAEDLVFSTACQQEPYGMKGVVRYKKIVIDHLRQEPSRFFGSGLIQNDFKEYVRVEQQSYFDPSLQSSAAC